MIRWTRNCNLQGHSLTFHCLRIAIRILIRSPFTSVINVLGLALALSVCVLTGLFVQYDWSFDSFHEKADHIYVVWRRM